MSPADASPDLTMLTVSVADRRVRVRRLSDDRVLRMSGEGGWQEQPRRAPQLMVPPLLDVTAEDAAVYIVTREGAVHLVPLDGRDSRRIEAVTWDASRPFAVAGDGRAVAVGSRIVTATGARFELEPSGARVAAIASAPDGFLVARETGRDWTCERVVILPEGIRSAWSVSWSAPAWLEQARGASASSFTRIAPQLSEEQPLVLLMPAPERGAPRIVRVDPDGKQVPIVQDWFDLSNPAVVAGDAFHYFSFDNLRWVALQGTAQREDWLDLDAVVARVGGTPGVAQPQVRALARDGQSALVRINGLPDAGPDWELVLVSRDGEKLERKQLPGHESLGWWLLPAPSP